MNLFDAITAFDVASPAVSDLPRRVRRAERYAFDLDSTLSAWGVASTKPSALLSALPMRRPPRPITWIEYPYKAFRSAAQLPLSPEAAQHPQPARTGFLIEETGDGCSTVTLAWGGEDEVSLCPVELVMYPDDARPDPSGAEYLPGGSPEELARGLREPGTRWGPLGDPCWNALPEDEIEAAVRLGHTWSLRLAPWVETVLPPARGVALAELAHRGPRTEDEELLLALMNDAVQNIAGEPPLLAGMLLLLNGEGALAIERTDLAKLNRARAKARKHELLEHHAVSLPRSATRPAGAAVWSLRGAQGTA